MTISNIYSILQKQMADKQFNTLYCVLCVRVIHVLLQIKVQPRATPIILTTKEGFYNALKILRQPRKMKHINITNDSTTQIIYRISWPIRCTEILEKNDEECILILVIYWKKTGLLHTKISNHNIIYSS